MDINTRKINTYEVKNLSFSLTKLSGAAHSDSDVMFCSSVMGQIERPIEYIIKYGDVKR